MGCFGKGSASDFSSQVNTCVRGEQKFGEKRLKVRGQPTKIRGHYHCRILRFSVFSIQKTQNPTGVVSPKIFEFYSNNFLQLTYPIKGQRHRKCYKNRISCFHDREIRFWYDFFHYYRSDNVESEKIFSWFPRRFFTQKKLFYLPR